MSEVLKESTAAAAPKVINKKNGTTILRVDACCYVNLDLVCRFLLDEKFIQLQLSDQGLESFSIAETTYPSSDIRLAVNEFHRLKRELTEYLEG